VIVAVQNVQQTASPRMLVRKSAVTNEATMVGFEVHCRRRYHSFNTWNSYRRGAEMLLEYLALTGARVTTMTEVDFGGYLYWLEYPMWVPGTPAVPLNTKGHRRAPGCSISEDADREATESAGRAEGTVPKLWSSTGALRLYLECRHCGSGFQFESLFFRYALRAGRIGAPWSQQALRSLRRQVDGDTESTGKPRTATPHGRLHPAAGYVFTESLTFLNRGPRCWTGSRCWHLAFRPAKCGYREKLGEDDAVADARITSATNGQAHQPWNDIAHVHDSNPDDLDGGRGGHIGEA